MPKPIDLYYWPTPNGWKITIMLEEINEPYQTHWVDIGAGDQFHPDFLEVSPNNRMPAIIDNAPADQGEPIAIFESGAILQYLAEKHGRFLPKDARGKYRVLQWLYWQVGGLGPMAGQAHHFRQYAPEPIPYSIDRYTDEVNRLYGVMDEQLEQREFLAGDYSIADMASWPWVVSYKRQGQDLEEFPNLQRWFQGIQARPAVERGWAVGRELRQKTPVVTEESRKVLFGQRARK